MFVVLFKHMIENLAWAIVVLLVAIYWRLGKLLKPNQVSESSLEVEKLTGKLDELKWELEEIKKAVELSGNGIEDTIEHFRKSSGALDELEHEEELFNLTQNKN